MDISIARTPTLPLSFAWVLRVACYAVLAYVSYYLITTVLQIYVFGLISDSGGYLQLADGIRTGGLFSFTGDLRGYGYPLFLALVNQFSIAQNAGGNWLYTATDIQFVLHTLTSLLGVSILSYLLDKRASSILRILCFALLQFNPILLGLTRDIMSDSLSVFFLTLFIWAILRSFPLHWLVVGIALAVSIVIRPFNLPWIVVLVGALALLTFLRDSLTQRRTAESTPEPPRSMSAFLKDRQRLILVGLQIGLPLLLIVGLQYILVARSGGGLSLIGKTGGYWQTRVLYEGSYMYRYQPYADPRGALHHMYYVSTPCEQIAIALNGINPLPVILADLPGTFYLYAVKTIAMFQPLSWSTYRTSLDTPSGYLLLFGLLLFFFFVYLTLRQWDIWRLFNPSTASSGQRLKVDHSQPDSLSVNLSLNLSFLVNLREMLHLSREGSTKFALWLAITLYILLYALVSVPEPRYIAAILPILTALAVTEISANRNIGSLLRAAVLASVLYLFTYEILLAAAPIIK